MQPHRPRRDYACFGPFEFERSQYELAVDAMIRCVEVDH